MTRRGMIALLSAVLWPWKWAPRVTVTEGWYEGPEKIPDASLDVFGGKSWDQVDANPIADLERLMEDDDDSWLQNHTWEQGSL